MLRRCTACCADASRVTQNVFTPLNVRMTFSHQIVFITNESTSQCMICWCRRWRLTVAQSVRMPPADFRSCSNVS